MAGLKEQIKEKIEAVADAIKGGREPVPEVFRVLSDAKQPPAKWLAAAKDALNGGQASLAKLILEAHLEAARGAASDTEARLLLVRACLKLGGPDGVAEALAVARYAHSLAAADESGPAASSKAACALCVVAVLGHRARLAEAQQHERQQDRSEALELLGSLAPGLASASAANPSSDAAASSAQHVAHAAYLRAALQAEQGQPEAALASARQALQLAEGQRDGGLGALCLAVIALLMSSRQQHRAALSVLSAASPAASASAPAAVASEPGLEADVLLTRIRSKLHRALSDSPKALVTLAQCKRRLAQVVDGKVPSAAGAAKPAAQELLVQVWEELAVLFAESGQQAEALVCVDNARALQPWAPSVSHALGKVYEECGDAGRAMQAYNDAVALSPCHASSLTRLGALYRKRGTRADLAVARDLLLEALRYCPTSAQAWYNLGLVASALEHRSEAEGHLLTAVQLAAVAPVLDYGCLPLPLPLPS